MSRPLRDAWIETNSASNRRFECLAPRQKTLDGKQEAKVIAMRLRAPPKAYPNRTLRLLARKVADLEVGESVSHQVAKPHNRHLVDIRPLDEI